MSHRTEQVGEVMQRGISAVLLRDIEGPRDCLITIMRVEVTPDLREAKVFVSILPERVTGTAMNLLERKKREIQRLLNEHLTMKFSPRITWELDLTTRKYAAIDEALKK
ncbi:MAG: ribosome-binding factor A [Patescibacteria group bacterium]